MENTNEKIGFIGQGWIGKNYADDFENRGYSVVRYALEEPYRQNKDKITNCDIVFIAVPTPTTPNGFDDTALISALEVLEAGQIVVIKSTTAPGKINALQDAFPQFHILHSPEFLVEKTAAYDAANPKRNIIGMPISDSNHRKMAERVLQVLPKAPYEKIMSARESELVKYAGNCFLFTKVVFMNTLYDISQALDSDYGVIREAVGEDPRIGHSHTQAIFDSGRGAGGHCFIKDFAAYTDSYHEEIGQDTAFAMLESMIKYNQSLLLNSNKDLDLLAEVYGSEFVDSGVKKEWYTRKIMERVAVLRGGPSLENSISMRTGGAVLEALHQLKYPTKDLVITKAGEWLDQGFVRSPEQALEGIDVVFVGLHGAYGEDGQVQRILERLSIPFTGSRALSSAIAFNKELTKQTLRKHSVRLSRHRRIDQAELPGISDELDQIMSDIGNELIVKPLTGGSSQDTHYVRSKESLHEALHSSLQRHDKVLVEEFIRGREASVGVLENFRDESIYSLPVAEIVPPNGNPIFTETDKYTRPDAELIPGRFSYDEKARLAETAAAIHKMIDCKHYSRSDFIIRDGEIYFLEVNTHPGLAAESIFPKAASAVGISYPQLIQHLINRAVTWLRFFEAVW